jgi:adenine-specific DNA-methyltransferase
VLTNFVRYTARGEEPVKDFRRDENGVIRENLIIKGNNLLALHTLKAQFRGQVKLIYIDPPYNTGTDSFGYNDSFNHSTWLTFMKNRLEVARELLSSDGSIWINIGDDEVHYLKVLCDEVFSRENFVRNVLWQKRTSPDTRATLGDGHDHILVFARKLEVFKEIANRLPKSDEQSASFKNFDNDPRGPWVSSDFTAQGYRPNQMYKIVTPGGAEYYPPEGRCWKNIESAYVRLVKEGKMWFGKDSKGVPRRKTYLNEVKEIAVWSWWTKEEVGHNQEAKKESIALFGADSPFATPKPERLLRRIIQIGSDSGDIVLDFFVGSGTSVAVAHKMGRQYIGIEQMDYTKNYVVERLIKVIGKETRKNGKMFEELEFDEGGISKPLNWQGGGDFIKCELMKYNEAFMKRIQTVKSSDELMQIWCEMAEGSFLNWYINPAMPAEAVKDFEELGKGENGLEKQKRLLAELLDKNQLYVNLSEIDDERFKVSKEDKALNKAFYGETSNA